jgi:cytochrome c-type biogenesis protein CcmI
MTALIVGTVLAVAALAFVLLPLFRDDAAAGAMSRRPPSVDRSEGDRERAVDALREIEFDRETGKLSDADYTALKASYTQRALVAMRAESELAPPPAADIDPVEMARASIIGQPVHLQSPLVPAILLLVSLANVNLGDHHKKVLWRACVVSLVMLLVGVLVGAVPFG